MQLPEIPPDAPSDVAPELYKQRFQKQLDIAETIEVTREDTGLAVENARTDKVLEVENARDDKVLEVANAREDKVLEVANAREDKATEVMEARVDADRAAETALLKSVHDAYIEVTKGTLDRSVARAQFLTATIGAVATTYTTLLGVNFAVANSKPAPGRALIPVLFLGLALGLAALYVAFLRRTASDRQLLPTGIGGDVAEERLKTFMAWTFAGVLNRAWAIRTSIVAFAVGIAVLPLPFVEISSGLEITLVGLGVAVVVVWAIWEAISAHRNADTSYVDDPPALAPVADDA
jgi:hypothetical protein